MSKLDELISKTAGGAITQETAKQLWKEMMLDIIDQMADFMNSALERDLKRRIKEL